MADTLEQMTAVEIRRKVKKMKLVIIKMVTI